MSYILCIYVVYTLNHKVQVNSKLVSSIQISCVMLDVDSLCIRPVIHSIYNLLISINISH